MSNILTALDVSGQLLNVGDIVLKASYSNITFHRIVKINRKSISLSAGAQIHTYANGTWVSRRYATRVDQVDLFDFNNYQPIRVPLYSSSRIMYSLYKID